MSAALRSSRYPSLGIPAERLSPVVLDKPIDRAHLARYTMGDTALEREILTLFIEHLPHTIRDLGLAETANDWHRAAHTLKGSARAVGAWRLADTAEIAERYDDVADRAGCEAFLCQIAEAAAETNAYVAQLIAGA